MKTISRPSRVAFVGDYTPRKCGIATFTHDLCEGVAAEFPKTSCIVGAVNDRLESYAYPPRVRFEFHEKEIDSYRRAADFLNINNVEVLCVQHEFGIYGGPAGSHLLALLQDVRMPVVTTLHTVLREPNPEQRKVMDELHIHSDRFVVMTQRGHDLLRTVYDVPGEKIDIVPHGIPDVPFVDPSFFKEQFGVEGRTVLLTFGLLSPNKGIEYVIEALPGILAKYPEVVYIVLGATHPNLVAREGESYRLSLERLAKARGVTENVIFYNRFVELEELQEFIGAADIYITPYLHEAQIVSGTLSYAFGSGKPVISTPYWHAQELLADDRGVLVPFRDSQAIADGVCDFLKNPSRLQATRKGAYFIGRSMIWPQVARGYMESFEKARTGRGQLPARKAFAGQTLEKRAYQLPPFKLDHLFRLTDNTGILQHAIFTVPNYSEGYCTDDNARAFILTVLLEELETQASAESLEQLAGKYLAFMAAAFEPQANQFRNFMGFNREWLEKKGSEDSHARALWAAGTALGRSSNDGYRKLCGQLFERGLPVVEQFTSPRAWAFTIIAIHEYLRRFSGDRVANAMRERLTTRLVEIYRSVSEPDWSWFETIASYDNARIPQALIMSGYWTSQPEVLEVGLQSLRWLLDCQISPEGHFRPIGSNGFHAQGKIRADFDQQPIEAYAMVAACLEAYRVTREERWWADARRAFEWFLGRNDLGIPLYDSATGGCHDAIHQDHANENEGAESSLAFYLALAEMKLAQNIVHVRLH
jgi:glycosyltransferase involved in cell wall biosynthesis